MQVQSGTLICHSETKRDWTRSVEPWFMKNKNQLSHLLIGSLYTLFGFCSSFLVYLTLLYYESLYLRS